MTLDAAVANGWCLVVFPERYGGGWRALIGVDMDSAALIEGELSNGDIGAAEMQRYLGNAGRWFPVSRGNLGSLSEALSDLSERLALVPDDETERWRALVRDAWESVRDAHRSAAGDDWWVGRALDEGRLISVG